MGEIEKTIADVVDAGIAKAVKPLIDEVCALRKIIESQTTPTDAWVKQKELPAKLGSIGLTKLRELLKDPNAPKPDRLGRYSVNEWREFVKNAPVNI